ncbi:MAG: hypothetical protein AAF653_04435 [Chloroflexota bacterium]
MYVDLTREDRAWIIEQLQKPLPASLRNDPEFVAAVGRYIETGSTTGFLWERFGKVIDYLQNALIRGNIHDQQGREDFLHKNAYQFIQLTGGDYLAQFEREFAAAHPDPSQASTAEKDAVAYDYSQREGMAYMQSDEGREMMTRMGAYWQEHGLPPMDNPRALRRYMEGATRASHPDKSEAEIQQMIDLTMGMIQDEADRERHENRRFRRRMWGCAAVALLAMVVIGGVMVGGLALYTVDHPLVNAVNLAIFAVVGGLSLFFYLRRNLDTPEERRKLFFSALLLAGIFAAMWYFGLLNVEAVGVSLRDDPDLLVITLLAVFGAVTGAALWLRRNVFRMLLWIALIGMAVIAVTVASQQGWIDLTAP